MPKRLKTLPKRINATIEEGDVSQDDFMVVLDGEPSTVDMDNSDFRDVGIYELVSVVRVRKTISALPMAVPGKKRGAA
jgi:hypothetical protein